MICDFGGGRYVIHRGIVSFVRDSGIFIYKIPNIINGCLCGVSCDF